ncbi:IS1 family transposase [Xenorhabdus griffiniae]|nr:IS1 family transposase [Xenorhabdus griffiniae]MDC9606059.1 IS1 family transposase [Xenorhabdus griffiniae]
MGASSKTHHRSYVWSEKQKNTQETLASFNVVFWCTDNFKADNLLPKSQHLVGKTFTQRIERENLTLRNRLKRLNRKTLGYSKSPEMHDKVIGTFIEREYDV